MFLVLIVVNTTSCPIRGRIEFSDLTQRGLYWGTIKIPGVPKDASGMLELGSFRLPFKCVSRSADSGYLSESIVFLSARALAANSKGCNPEIYDVACEPH